MSRIDTFKHHSQTAAPDLVGVSAPQARVICGVRFDDSTQILIAALQVAPGIGVVGQVSTLAACVNLAAAEQPSVVILDLRLLETACKPAFDTLRSAAPGTRILCLGWREDRCRVVEAIQAGADGFWFVGAAGLVALPKAVHDLQNGGAVLDSQATRVLLDYFGSLRDQNPALTPMLQPGVAKVALSHISQLSARDRRLLQALARGWTNRQIAASLGLTEGTVKNAMTALFPKLGVLRRTEAVTWFLSRQWEKP